MALASARADHRWDGRRIQLHAFMPDQTSNKSFHSIPQSLDPDHIIALSQARARWRPCTRGLSHNDRGHDLAVMFSDIFEVSCFSFCHSLSLYDPPRY